MRLSPLFKPCGSDALRRKGGGVGGGNVGLGSPVVVIHIVGYDCKIQISQSSSHVDVNTEPFVRIVVFKHAVAVVVVEAHGSDSRRLGGEQSVVDRQPVRRRCRVFIVHACQAVAVGIEAELMVCRGIGGKSIEWLQSHFSPRSVGDGKLAAHVAGRRQAVRFSLVVKSTYSPDAVFARIMMLSAKSLAASVNETDTRV